MDAFLPQLGTTDTRTKLSLGADIISYLEDEENTLECSDIGQFIDGLVPWLTSSNFKVAQNGLDALTFLVDRMGNDFRPYLTIVLPPIIDRLGDSKDLVREKANQLIMKMMDSMVTPQHMFERLTPAFSHKNGKIREELMECLQQTLKDHGAQSLSVSRLVPAVSKLLSDPIATVRDTAFNTLAEMYRHVGERLRQDLTKKNLVPASKMPALMSRFDEIRANGELMPSALTDAGSSRYDDEPDRVLQKRSGSLPRRQLIAPVKAPSLSGAPVSGLPPPSATSVRRTTSLRRTTSSAGQAGALDEDAFIRQFEDVPTMQLFSARELDEHMNAQRSIIEDVNKDWSKRVDALKKIRSLIIAGAPEFEELREHLRLLEPAFQLSVKDLRSQVVREACITIAFLSQTLRHKFDHFAESVLSNLIILIPNSTKVMASSGFVTIRFIISNTPATRLIPIMTNFLTTSKAKEIRRACCEFLEQMMNTWPTHTLERHIAILQDAIKKGIADADPDARQSSRRAFWGFQSHFSDQADSLLNSLDSAYRRQLQMEGPSSMSASSSSSSLHQTTLERGRGAIPRSRASSVTGSAENLYRGQSVGPRRSGIPVLTSTVVKGDPDRQPHPVSSPRHRASASASTTPLRSNSAIDLQAAQRAKARAQYAAAARLKVGSGASLPRQRKSSDSGTSISAITSPERVGRTRTRISGVSQSQPTSRSGSPSSRLSYATYRDGGTVLDSGPTSMGSMGRPRRLGGGIPRSTGTSREASRETSPNRYSGNYGPKLSRPRTGLSFERTPQGAGSRTVMAQKILQQSREAENALADALNFDGMDDFQRTPTRKPSRLFDDHSDESETSSICSERSYDSFRRPSDFWSNSQPRQLYRDNSWEPLKGIGDFIAGCASTHWQDRKEGLVGVQRYLQSGHRLTLHELRRVTEIFTKIFMDSHTKVFSLFLDAVNDLIVCHKDDLHDWLYILVTRLFNKLGTDLLNSTQKKIHLVLEVIRDSFPAELQFGVLMRFLVDATQTPNSRVKLAALCYVTALANVMEPSAMAGGGRDTRPALAKIITWTSDPKSMDIRRASGAALNALFNLNMAEVTMMLSDMPSDYQDIARRIVEQHARYGDTSLPSSPRVSSPGTPTTRVMRTSRHNVMDDDDSLNPEDVHRSLQRTTAEIQNYSFDGGVGKMLDRDRDTTSQDSGISQMSTGPCERLDVLEERFEELSISPLKHHNNGCIRSPVSRASPVPQRATSSPLREFNGLDKTPSREGSFDTPDNGFINRENHHPEDPEALRKLMEVLGVGQGQGVSTETEKKTALAQLARIVREGNAATIVEHFKLLLRVLLEQLGSSEASVRTQVMVVLTEMFNKTSLTTSFTNYVELLVLRVLQCHKDPVKDVARTAEQCAAAMVSVLPSDLVIRVLSPLITTAEYPLNQAAIKMLNRLVENRSNAEVESHLPELMPLLLKAYDNDESSVRKSAVFCLVALHNSVGEECLQPHLSALTGSKLKLLNLYIRRAKQEASTGIPTSTPSTSSPTSPKNMPTS